MVTDEDIASWDYAQLWDKFPVPARPYKEELEFLSKNIKPYSKVLILGSTIEYRSLCKQLNIKPTIADFDKAHYNILTKYSNEKFPNEDFIEIDWLDINEHEKYDYIIGHRAFNVIGKNMMGKFFSKMYYALKPGGIFYCKGNIYPGTESLLKKIKLWTKKEKEYPLFSYIEVDLYFHCADSDGYVNYIMARKLFKDLYEKGNFSTKDYELIKILISMSSEARFRGKVFREEIINSTGQFQFEEVILDKDICEDMPILILSKNHQ